MLRNRGEVLFGRLNEVFQIEESDGVRFGNGGITHQAHPYSNISTGSYEDKPCIVEVSVKDPRAKASPDVLDVKIRVGTSDGGLSRMAITDIREVILTERLEAAA